MKLKLNTNPYSEKDAQEAWNQCYNDKVLTMPANLLDEWQEGFKAKQEDLSKIPDGPYCYHGSRAPGDKNYCACPYWSLKEIQTGEFKGEKYGYCSLLKLSDYSEDKNEEVALALHDQVKECFIKRDY